MSQLDTIRSLKAIPCPRFCEEYGFVLHISGHQSPAREGSRERSTDINTQAEPITTTSWPIYFVVWYPRYGLFFRWPNGQIPSSNWNATPG
jgi:hypothetical protein